jgi:hypothetical protein
MSKLNLNMPVVKFLGFLHIECCYPIVDGHLFVAAFG